MARVVQFYGGDGAPFAVPGTPETVAAAWSSHRDRLRGWFAALPEERWTAPTRCTDWNVMEIAQHLISGAQFLGYTLHHARKGEPTRLLAEFDSQATAAATTAVLAGRSPAQLLEDWAFTDGRVASQFQRLDADDAWQRPAEAPPGQVPAYVALNHMLFDSWVHERDVMLPAGETPVIDPNEAAVVASYVVGLAGIARTLDDGPPAAVTLQAHLTDIDRQVRAEVRDGRADVTFVEPTDGANVSAPTGDLVDFTTGRIDSVSGDSAGIAYLSRLATVMQ